MHDRRHRSLFFVRRMIRDSICCMLAAAVLAGCGDGRTASGSSSHTDSSVPPPKITESQAGAFVTNLARQKKIKLEDHQRPKVEFDAVSRQWEFFYTLKLPGMPGGHFSIKVDETGSARFIGGM